MKKIYILCIVIIALLAVLYTLRLISMGFDIRQGAVFFGAFALTFVMGFLIVKLFAKKISKNMEDN